MTAKKLIKLIKKTFIAIVFEVSRPRATYVITICKHFVISPKTITSIKGHAHKDHMGWLGR